MELLQLPSCDALAPVREIIPSTGFTVLAAAQAPVLAGAQYRHTSAVCLTSLTGPWNPANQCLPSPDRSLLSILTLSAYVSVKYGAVISVLPRLAVFALA